MTPAPLCATLALLAAAPPPLLLPPGTHGEHDVYGLSGAAYSEHFALRWGTPSPLVAGDIDRLLGALEYAWAVEVEQWGLAAPPAPLNVYIGDTGGPASEGAWGYYSRDPEGWPMLVLSPGMVAASDETLTTIPHEFFHALQDASGHFVDTEVHGWIWESTASWAEGALYPDDPAASLFLFGYALQPHLPLDLHTPFSAGRIEEYRSYGAALFHRYLDEHVPGGRDLVLDVWRAPADPADPTAGLPVAEVLGDFAAHNAAWDYERPEILTAHLEQYAADPRFAPYDSRIVARHGEEGSGGEWRSPPAGTLPQRWGYNVVSWQPSPGEVSVEVEVDGVEVADPLDWQVVVVIVGDGGVRYLPAGAVSVAEGEVIWLVVASLEGGSYRYRLTPAQEDIGDSGIFVEGPAEEGCGGRGLAGLVMAWGWGHWRRRRGGGGAPRRPR